MKRHVESAIDNKNRLRGAKTALIKDMIQIMSFMKTLGLLIN